MKRDDATDPRKCGITPRPRKTHDIRAVAAAVQRDLGPRDQRHGYAR